MKIACFLWIVIFLFCSLQSFSQTAIKGNVSNSVTRERLAGAFISCSNNKKSPLNAITDNDGTFFIGGLAPGEYDLKIEYIGYETYSVHVSLSAGRTVELAVPLAANTRQLENVHVFGKLSQEEDAGARQKEKRSDNLVNVISARAMEHSPDINAANVLQRMSGLTIQRNGGGDEAYAIIRGLDPRYSNTLINGIKITSPDDKSRYVPLNIVPSDLLGSIEVSKSLLPEMEGDAIGGTVNMVMKDAPEKETFKVLGSLGYNKIFIDQRFERFSRADIEQKSPIEKYGSGYSAQPGDFSRSNLKFEPVTPMPNTVAAITYGRRFLDRKLGILVAESIQNQYYGS